MKKNVHASAVSEQSERRVLRTLYKNVRIPWLSLIAGAFLAVFNSLVILSQYDNYNAIFSGSMTDLTPLWMYLLFSFIQYVLIFGSIIAYTGFVKIVTGVRKKLWRRIMRLPMSDFDSEEPNGMLSRITSDAEYAAQPFYMVIVILQILVYLMSMSAAAPKDIPQSMVILAVTMLMAIAVIIIAARMNSRSTTIVQNRISAQTASYCELLAGIRFIKASNAEEKAIAKSDGLIEARYESKKHHALAEAVQSLADNFTNIIIYACAFLGGALAIKAGTAKSIQPVNDVYLFGVASQQSLQAIMGILVYFSGTMGGSKKIVSILRREEEDTTSGSVLDDFTGDITAKDVSFSYDDRTVIDGVSAVIPSGKVTAVVGPNGSGKSTLVKLVDRLYPAGNGEIFIGGNAASDVSLSSWRKGFGVVSQNASLFSGSIRDNICYGAEGEIGDEKLDEAVRLSGLENVLQAHPEGLDYDIGLRGSGLSGGEQQRVAIARALMKDPEILILDEATANLDARTEQDVKDGLAELMKGRTVIVIAHNWSAVEGADRVIVLDEGKVADSGTLEEVLERDPFLRRMRAEG